MPRENGRSTDNPAKLVDVIRRFQRLVVFGHDNPDPDYLASALAVRFIARSQAGIATVITRGGVLGRAENRAMARLLRIHLTPVEEVSIGRHTGIVLLDTQPGTGNNSLPREVTPHVIIDHHPRRPRISAPLADIRTEYGATSTILTEYLSGLGMEVSSPVATALTYGIASETLDLSRETGERDIHAYLHNLLRANKRHLAQIIHPKVPRYYFSVINRALRQAFCYRSVIGASLGEVTQPDVIAQIADFLLTHERMSFAICSGFFGDQLLISVRSSSSRVRLGRILKTVVGRHGTAGGHEAAAAAQITCHSLVPSERVRLEESLLLDFVAHVTRQKLVELKPLLA
jgi:nanoRNase/pAp phosphatase (c-di-AMP/oligoRNAs hydrolase)